MNFLDFPIDIIKLIIEHLIKENECLSIYQISKSCSLMRQIVDDMNIIHKYYVYSVTKEGKKFHKMSKKLINIVDHDLEEVHILPIRSVVFINDQRRCFMIVHQS